MKKIAFVFASLFVSAACAFGAQNKVSGPGVVTWLNPGADVAAEELIDLGDRYGVALTDISSNRSGAVAIDGVWIFALPTNQNVSAFGTRLYYSTATNVTTTASDEKYVGASVETVATNSGFVKVYLNAPVGELVGSAATPTFSYVTLGAATGLVFNTVSAAPTGGHTATNMIAVQITIGGTNATLVGYRN